MTEWPTAREARVSAKADAARLFCRLLAEHDVTQLDIARACGVTSSIVQRWADRDRPETPSIADVRAMPLPVALGLLGWMADPHDQVITDRPETVSLADELEHLAATISECGEAATVTARALADGQVSPAEAREIDNEAADAIAHLQGLRERARAAVPVRVAK